MKKHYKNFFDHKLALLVGLKVLSSKEREKEKGGREKF